MDDPNLPDPPDMETASLSPAMSAVVTIVLGIMIFCTIIGNILVCLSVVLVKKLRQPSNYLLVSLAVSDLCVALLVMPLALYQEVSPTWGLGQTVCNMWVSFDVTCCTASILNLCTISIDRYLTITRPLTYGVNATAKRSFCFIAAIWIASCLISVPPLLVFGNEHGSSSHPDCQVSQNITYQLYATLGAFYIPLAVMIIMYYKIYIAAKRVVEAEMKAQPSGQGRRFLPRVKKPTTGTKGSIKVKNRRGSGKKRDFVLSKNEGQTEIVPLAAPPSLLQTPSTDMTKSDMIMHHPSSPIMSKDKEASGALTLTLKGPNGVTCVTEGSMSSPSKIRFLQPSPAARSVNEGARPSSGHDLRERKASITLGVIMTAFIFCWLPFFILALLRPFFSFSIIPNWIGSFALWLGYANSTLNPVIYVTFHQDFRKAFKYLLCCQCATMGTRLREEAYQSQYGVWKTGENTKGQSITCPVPDI